MEKSIKAAEVSVRGRGQGTGTLLGYLGGVQAAMEAEMKKIISFVAIQFLLCMAYASSPAFADDGSSFAGDGAAVSRTVQIPQRDATERLEVGEQPSGLPVVESDCVKEGESCNVIVDRCCPGYSCQGGVTATCVRN
jgi:hypothetical protein